MMRIPSKGSRLESRWDLAIKLALLAPRLYPVIAMLSTLNIACYNDNETQEKGQGCIPEHLLALALEVCGRLRLAQLVRQQLVHLLRLAVRDGLCRHTPACSRPHSITIDCLLSCHYLALSTAQMTC